MTKQLYIKTFGCQMNIYDSHRMADALTPLGYRQIEDSENADLIILNTCNIRHKATEKLYSELGRLETYKKSRGERGIKTSIVVAGCVGQAEGKEVLQRAPCVDIVVGPQTYHRLPDMVTRLLSGGESRNKGLGMIDIEFPAEPKFDHLPRIKTSGYSGFLTIQEGCDKFCTFCVVPYTRGAEYSRPVEDIIVEARQMVAAGIREITLLGQNVNAYRGSRHPGETAEVGLGQLLREVAEIQDLEVVRYTTSHPSDMNQELIRAHKDLDKLAPLLHLPVQTGSDKMLDRMNRGHSRNDYFRIIDKLLKAQPNLKLSSDFMVGFPGETDKDFRSTMSLIAELDFIQAYSFKYSPRPGTPGATLDDQIPEEIKTERLKELQNFVAIKQHSFNESCVGHVMPVLLDRQGRRSGQLAGRSPYMQAVHVAAPPTYIGKIVALRIEEALPNSLAGAIAEFSD